MPTPNQHSNYLDARMRRLEQIAASAAVRLMDYVLDRNDLIQYLEHEYYYLKEELFSELRSQRSYFEGRICELEQG